MEQDSPVSGTQAAQKERWSALISQWERALSEDKEVLVLMDANIDFLRWTDPSPPANSSTARTRPMVEELFSRIFPHGVSQLVTVPTRSWPGQPDTGIDHLYSNKPDKLSEVQAEFLGGSDHKLLKVTRFSRTFKPSARYVRKRSYKNFNESEFIERVKLLTWIDLYLCEDADMAASIISEKLNLILDEMAPVKTIHLKKHYAT